MTRIKKLSDNIKEELGDARKYAECYVDSKVSGNTAMMTRYKEMATDELKHASYLHEMAVTEISRLSQAVTAPDKMTEKWNRCHAKYVQCSAWIRQMLTM